MKKGKLIISCLALLIAIGGAYAFKVNDTLPGDLYYVNEQSACVRAPCEIENHTSNECLNSPLYTDNGCNNVYSEVAYTTNGGK